MLQSTTRLTTLVQTFFWKSWKRTRCFKFSKVPKDLCKVSFFPNFTSLRSRISGFNKTRLQEKCFLWLFPNSWKFARKKINVAFDAQRHHQLQDVLELGFATQAPVLMTLWYVETPVWAGACVAKPTSSGSCSWWWPCYTETPGNYSICLLGQKILATIFFVKI